MTRRWLAPEVIQTSAMDCGPASLKCLLEGFGIQASYGRLREACQTDVDGTSVDTLEELMPQLGLEAEQVMIPLDHVLLREADVLPAIAVTRQPNGLTHFVVLWRVHGPFVQIMDPASGRRWVSRERLLSELYVHDARVPASAFREWAASDDVEAPLRARLRAIGAESTCASALAAARADEDWRTIAAFDAALRMTSGLVRGGGFARGAEAGRAVNELFASAREKSLAVPFSYWTARPVAEPARDDRDDHEEEVILRGAVLVRVRRPAGDVALPPPRSPELALALTERPDGAWATLSSLVLADGPLTVALLVFALIASVAGTALEALLFRALFGAGRALGLVEQRLAAVLAFAVLAVGLLALEWSTEGGVLRLGRRLESRLRMAFLAKIPRLGDRYFQSRPTSDMAERSHAIHGVRGLPELGSQIVRGVVQLAVTTVAIAWIDPRSAPLAILAALAMVMIPLFAQPALLDRDARARSHLGALSRSYLDGLLGLVPLRTHGAERSLRREHESLLVEWARAAHASVQVFVAADVLQTFAAYVLTVAIVLGYATRASDPGAALLLVYWTLDLPVIGESIALALRRYPAQRSRTLRLLEPLGAKDEDPEPVGASVPLSGAGEGEGKPPGPMALAFEDVSALAGGHTILDHVDLVLAPGEHVAIVGASGAGKSSLIGLLLGWHRPSGGRVLVDGKALEPGSGHEALRARTAWVDPSIQIWNHSLLENLRYGASGAPRSLAPVLDAAHLRSLLEALPDGLQTSLGEGGALVSGGEGQRVRLGRAFGRPEAGLVLLDEPFRGLDRMRRGELLDAARAWWKDATLLCVTHDLAETSRFDRVLVIDGGKLVEDGSPAELRAREGSHYRALLETEETLRSAIWSGEQWKRLRVEGGKLLA